MISTQLNVLTFVHDHSKSGQTADKQTVYTLYKALAHISILIC